MVNKNVRWILLAGLVLIIFLMRGKVPVESVADIEGQLCSVDKDCPCWGKYNYTTALTEEEATAYGIGVADCKAGVCDITYCFDIQEVGVWARDKPWVYLKENVLFTILILGLLVWVVFFWPKK